MPAEYERVSHSLAENLITLLYLDKDNGRIVANLAGEDLFTNEAHQLLVRRALAYWKKHGRPPGKNHAADLVDDVLEDSRHPLNRVIRDMLVSMIALYDSNLNTKYVIDTLQAHMRLVAFRRAIFESADLLDNREHLALAEVEEMWGKVLRTRHVEFKAGVRLGDYRRMLDWMESRAEEFMTGVTTLDRAGVAPARGHVMLYLGAKGSGKSWFLINLAKRALRMGKRVLYVTLELYWEETLQRFYQALFAVPKTSKVRLDRMARIEFDQQDHFAGIVEQLTEAEWSLDSPIAETELASHLLPFGNKIDNLIIEYFPSSTLSMNMLRAYLDNLELVHQWIPDLICVDYFGLVKTDYRNKTESLTSEFLEFRGLLAERNMAGATAQQLTRRGAAAMVADSTKVAEAWAMVAAADDVLVFSASEAERVRGLGRLALNHSRSSTDHWTTLLTQNYQIGQYCLDAIRLPRAYQDYLSRINTQTPDSEEEDDVEE